MQGLTLAAVTAADKPFGPLAAYIAHNEDIDQSVQMPRLI